MTTFGEQLRGFAHKTDTRLNVIVKKVIFDVSTRLVYRSPVGDAKYWKSPAPPGYVGGRFRANWQYGLDAIDLTTTLGIDPSGQSTLGRVTASIPANVLGHVHYLTNSLPYSFRLEDGWSRQAPANGIVGITVLEFDSVIREAAAELS